MIPYLKARPKVRLFQPRRKLKRYYRKRFRPTLNPIGFQTMKTLPAIPLTLLALAVIPLSLFLWTSSNTLQKQIHSTVVNDPQTGLAQSLNVIQVAVNQWGDNINGSAVHFSENENFKKFIALPTPSLAAFKIFGQKLSDSTHLPLIILSDKKGNDLYDNVNIPKPSQNPTPDKKQMKPKAIAPPQASLKDFPGMDRALAGASLRGFFSFQGSLYNGSLVPVLNKGKNTGVIILGALVNDDLIRRLKSESINDLAIYSQAQTWCSSTVPPPSLDYPKMMAGFSSNGRSNNSVPVDWNHGSYLAGLIPLEGLDGRPAAYLSSFQPIKQTLTVVGFPQKNLARQGRWFLFMGVLLAAAAAWQFMAPFNRLLSAVDKIKTGSQNIDLPLNRPDEWGRLARSLQEMTNQLKEKERVSLILGKVVSPKIARNILEAKDLFALKGERREVTLLHADLRGFNTLSENMPPPALVEALNQYFTLINEAVFKHEGMMDKFIGETAIALWGAPFTHDDKERRAVQTALEIQESLKDFNISRIKKGNPPFTLGIGIHTGLVVSGNLGSDKRSDYTVIGDPLHVAARLCAMAAPGQTVVSEETYQKIKGQVKARTLNPIVIKGSLEPLKTYEITELT